MMDSIAQQATSMPVAAAVSSTDRLTFTVFLALVLHALVILGVSFNADLFSPPAPTLEITLATHKAGKEPDEANYLAQFNQEASGISDKDQPLTTDQLAKINDTSINHTTPFPQVKASKPEQRPEKETIITIASSHYKVDKRTVDTAAEEARQQLGNASQTTPLSLEIASLKARLDEQRQAIAKRPRIRRVTSVATKSAVDAAYIGRWIETIERIGNKNFPAEALNQGIFGKLRLAVTLKANGTIHTIEVLESSRHSVLDNAALQIVHTASPFPPFPVEMRKDADLLEIIRTWNFEISGLSTSND
jgi:protein TonB